MNEANRLKLIAINTGKIRHKDLTGARFGSLTVISFVGRDKKNGSLWLCKCDCGGETTTRTFMLNSGRTNSCGCIHKFLMAAIHTKERKEVSEKICPTCNLIKNANMFGKDKSRPNGLQSQCCHCKNVEYKRKNSGKVNLAHALRKKLIKQATPKWVNRKDLEEFYIAAAIMTKETGISYHVDHIMPINHPLLCGLNVPWNLQILKESENCSKGNKISHL